MTMTRFAAPIPALVLCSLAAAQGGLFSPAEFELLEGSDFSHIFGRYADARFQFAEGGFKGTPHKLTHVAYRLDYRNHDQDTATGRTWSKVTLDLADCDYDKVTAFWNLNALSTPTRVFSGSVSWPTQVGYQIIKPDAWGHLSGRLRMAFSTAYVYTGNSDLLLDYDFSGGVLDNRASWAFTDGRFYYLDGENVTTAPMAGAMSGYPSSGTCADSALSATTGAASSIAAIVYSTTDPDPNRRGKLQVYHQTLNTAPNAVILQALGLSGLPNGVPVGARCNDLFLDVSQPWLPIYGVTDNNGTSPRSPGNGDYLVTWDQTVFADLPIWTQGAWTDSSTNSLGLTRAAVVTVPPHQPLNALPRRKAIYHYAKSLGVAIGPTTGHEVNPFVSVRYN